MISNSQNRHAGFTLVEVLLVSGLTSLLALILAGVWSGLGRPLVEAVARGQITREANLAADALARDFGGTLPGTQGCLGGVAEGKLVGRMQPANLVLRLCFDGGPVADGLADWGEPDTVISYEVQDGNLVRWDERSGTTFTVAQNVQQMELAEQGNGVEIKLTFAYHNITRTYTLVGLDP
jgi:prepilin-type N-terminal cleavage/methylation domain-containing protein